MTDIPDISENPTLSNLSGQVYEYIKRMIMTAKLQMGEVISEKQIAEKLSVSRTPIREALQKLEKDGLVVIEPRRNTKVASISLEDKEHIGQIRIQLDVLAARLLAEQGSLEDCAALKDIANRCLMYAEAGDFASCFEMDSLFHCQMAERSGNPFLADLTRRLDHKVQLLRNLEDVTIEQVKERISLHVPIIQAISRHDAGNAADLMFSHLSNYYMKNKGKA
ncbi:MAG: GntR family transcriptional regulator [Rectinemataceae bacterium]